MDVTKKETLTDISKTLVPVPLGSVPGSPSLTPPSIAPDVQKVTKEELAELLQAPFDITGMITGSKAFEIDIMNNQILVNRFYNVCVKFGWDKAMASKYVDLAFFGSMYLGAWAGCISEYREEGQQANEKEKRESQGTKPGQSIDTGKNRERKDTPGQVNAPGFESSPGL